ncbi:hypothetical protein Trydic_g4220 [Trypoxylus dichotomus]
MSHEHLDMHIVLNEDSIDLREEIFEKPSIKNRSLHKTTSHQIISPTQISGELKDRRPLRVNGLRRLANNLYYGEQSNILQKTKTALRAKQRNRATSADPRFRRERSPAYSKEASQTQSDSQVMDLPIQFKKKKNKTHSDSKFVLSPITKKAVPKPSGPYPADQSEPINRKPNLDLETTHYPPSESMPDKTSNKYSTSSHIYSCNTLTPSNIEQSTMTEEIRSTPTIVDCKSLYQSAMTDTDTMKHNTEVELYNTTTMYLSDKEPLKSYWDDPRLIEKYSKLLKPVSAHKSKSSLTLPLIKPTTNTVTVNTKCHPSICSKCVCADLCGELEGSYPIYEEIGNKTVNYERIRGRLYNAMRSNYYLAAFFMIGSLCGLMLVTLVIWVLANDIIWSSLNKREPPKLTGFRWLSAYIGGAILHSINIVFNKFYYMIIMPRNEVFDLLKMEDTT